MSSKALRQITELNALSVPELQARRRKLFGTEPPGYNRAFLIKRLAYEEELLTRRLMGNTNNLTH